MYAEQIIQRLLGQECPSIHAKRRTSIASVVGAALRGGLCIARMGVHLKSLAKPKHRIKCCDRLLSNPHLAAERVEIYRAMSRRLLKGKRHVQVAVDWSQVRENGSAQLLRAATIVKGRAFTLYEEVHPQKNLGAQSVHASFMATLQTMVPPHCTVIIITDAGFRATWFKLLDRLGFAWVGRIRNVDQVCKQRCHDWRAGKTLHGRACAKVRDLGDYFYARTNAIACRLVLFKSKSKRRHRLTKTGVQARSRRSKKNSASQREPWLLAVSPSLSHIPAEAIVKIYAGRMQIEQTFRDLKNGRWGMGLSNSQTSGLRRLAALLLIGALLTYALWLIGLAARKAGYDISYGSRSKAATTLSIMSLAMHWIDDYRRPKLHAKDFRHALTELISMVATLEFEG